MSSGWNPTTLDSVAKLEKELSQLEARGWLFRGQSKARGSLVPSIDRPPLDVASRAAKLELERQSIEIFRRSLKYLTSESERLAMQDDHIALMVLRHYDVPTRLLDWSLSPYVAAFFAADGSRHADGEIWAFDERHYRVEGAKQWKRWPQTTRNGEFHPQLTMFLRDLGEIDWFVCTFYFRDTFPRQFAQKGAFSLTAHFGQDHSVRIATMMGDQAHYRRFRIPAEEKVELLTYLRQTRGISRETLFPDAAGAAQTAAAVFPKV
jgi:hypothetical protein